MVLDTYVISLSEKSERFKLFEKNNCHLTFNTLNAVRGADISQSDWIKKGYATREAVSSKLITNGSIGCALSHHNLWKRCLKKDRPMLILEDDVSTHPKILDYMDLLDLDNIDILFFCTNTNTILKIKSAEGLTQSIFFEEIYPNETEIMSFLQKTSIYDVRLYRFLRGFGTCCYLITPTGAKKFLRNVLPLRIDGVAIPFINPNMPGISIDRRMNALYDNMNSYVCMPFLAYTPNSESTTA